MHKSVNLVLLRERLSDFIEKWCAKQSKSNNKSYIELIALYVHPKNSNHLQSHLRAIMALDHSRLGLENESGQFFAIGKFTLQNLANKSGGMQTSLLYFFFIHYIWDETAL